jgi:hypothetical protein
VGFVLNEGIAGHKVVWQSVNDILLEAQNYFTQGADHPFSAALCAVLGWPSSVTITKVSVRSEKEQKMSIEKIEDFLNYVRKDVEPWVWLDTTSVTRKNLTDANQADYTRHPVLQLEKWLDTLTEQDAGYATSLFALLRRNHRRSRDFVEDLTGLFAPLRQLNTVNSERSRSMLETLDDHAEVLPHASHLAKLESLATELDGTPAEDARAVLYLIRRGFRTCHDSMDELKVIFGPLQQRNAEELKRAVQIKKVFEAIDEEAETIYIG